MATFATRPLFRLGMRRRYPGGWVRPQIPFGLIGQGTNLVLPFGIVARLLGILAYICIVALDMKFIFIWLKLYNDQRNAQGFNSFINLLLPYMFRAFF
jgi:hypothetical protein